MLHDYIEIDVATSQSLISSHVAFPLTLLVNCEGIKKRKEFN